LEVIDNQGIQLLRVTGFRSFEKAEEFFQRLRGALYYLTVGHKLSIRSDRDMQMVRLLDSPVDVRGNPNWGEICEQKGWTQLDGYVDPFPAVVIPEHLRIMEIGVGPLSVTIGTPVPMFLEHLAGVLALPKPESITADERLSLAIDLYASSLWETSRRARVVSLATALEALIKPERVSQAASDQIDQLLNAFDSARDCLAEDQKQRSESDSIRSRLASLKNESISERLRRLAVAHASDIGVTTEQARHKMVSAYGVRSKLVHDGNAPEAEIEDAAAWLDKAVPAILKSSANEVSKAR